MDTPTESNTDPEPVFTIRARDLLAYDVVYFYGLQCRWKSLHHQAEQVRRALDEIAAWQRRHPDLIKAPDHDHVPASPHSTPGVASEG